MVETNGIKTKICTQLQLKKYGDIEKHLRDYQKLTGKYIVFQGELCGPGIQSNRLGLKEKEWFIFNVWESDTGKMDSYKKLDFLRFLNMCDDFGLKTVPIIPVGNKFDFKTTNNIDETVENLLKYVDNIKYRTYLEKMICHIHLKLYLINSY